METTQAVWKLNCLNLQNEWVAGPRFYVLTIAVNKDFQKMVTLNKKHFSELNFYWQKIIYSVKKITNLWVDCPKH